MVDSHFSMQMISEMLHISVHQEPLLIPLELGFGIKSEGL